MRIEVSQPALHRLLQHSSEEKPIVKVAYDAEGCGCAVDGVVQLWRVSGFAPDDRIGYDGEAAIIYDRRHEIFFEDNLRLDYQAESDAFTLKSDNQIYHASLIIHDKTGDGSRS